MDQTDRGAEESLPLDAMRRIYAVCVSFEKAWQAEQGPRPRIEDFLDGATGAERGALLRWLLQVELGYRLARGDCPVPPDYEARFPGFEPLIRQEIGKRRPGAVLAVAAATLGAPRNVPDTSPRVASEASPIPADLAVPGYELLGELGRGGMGVVYKAWQIKAKRFVALKMIKAGDDADPEELARFRTEGEAVARLQHPNIVQVFDVAEHDGLPYFSLEFCPGGSLDRKLKGNPLPPIEAAKLTEPLARAMHAAHQKGVLHRDLKPANVLFAEDGTPKVTDFGLAKKLDDTGQTREGTVMGTPSYMPPEQAAGRLADLGPAADVYSLGAVLYEMLTGRPPFKAANFLETLIQVRHDEPVPPSRLVGKVPRDLETICLKCLHKEPGKRYASAQALADDLERWRRGEPILARPVGRLERARKWVRRRPALAAALLLGVLGVLGVAWQAWQKTEALTRAEKQLYLNRIKLAHFYFTTSQLNRVAETLHLCPPPLRGWEWHYLRRLCRLERKVLSGHAGPVKAIQYSPDGRLLATTSKDGTIRTWDVETGKPLRSWPSGSRFTHSVCFSGDGRLLITASQEEDVTVWDVANGKPLQRLPGAGSMVAASHEGRLVATVFRHEVVTVWNLAEQGGRALLRERFRLPSLPNENQILDVALSPNGRYLAVGAWNRLVRVWEILPPAALAAVSAVTAPLQPGGQPWTAAGQAGASAWLFERAGYRPLPPLSLESQPDVTHVRAVNFSADSKFLAGGSSQSSIWDVETGKHLGLSFVGTGDLICYCITFSSKGSRLAATFGDGLVRVWDTRDGSAAMTAQKQKEAVGGAVFSPVSDDHLAVIRGAEVTIENINPASRQTSFVLEGKGRELETVAFSPDGTHLACRAAGGAVTLWDVAERTLLRTMHPAGAARQEGGLAFLDADRLAAPDGRSGLGMWRVPSGRVGAAVVPPGHARVAAFSRAAGRVATADRGSRIRLWDVDSGDLVRELGQASLDVKALAFSPDGRQLAACGSNATVILWSAETGKVLRTFHGHTLTVGCVAFSPDGRLLATGSADLTVRVWDARTAEPLHVLRGHSGYVSGVCFNGDRDSARLASCGLDRAVKLWDPHAGEEVLTLTGHTAHVAAVAFSPDGRLLASCGHDGTVRLWDATPVDEDRPE